MKNSPKLGILRLDYNYPPAPGDIDCPKSFSYSVIYRVIPGLTFEMCQSGNLTDNVIKNCINAVKFLNEQNVSGITGDCGFMINIQHIIAKNTDKPVFLSSLIQLPTILNTFSNQEMIAIFTANSITLNAIKNKLNDICGLNNNDNRLEIVGCQNVKGFDSVSKGEKVNTQIVTPGIVNLAKKVLKNNPKIKCILLECTELPPYSDSLRKELDIPIFDAITNCDSFMNGFLDNKHFGIKNWQDNWDGTQKDYNFGDNLNLKEKKKLIN